MTLDEAQRVLELAEGASESEIRKAYTRLVKHHKPESDPEGFRQIREAYECLRDAAARRHARATAPAPMLVEPAPEDTSRAKLAVALRGASLEERVSILEAHLEGRPDDDDARWTLIETLEDLGDEPRATAALEQGARAGRSMGEFAATLLRRDPWAGDEALLARMRGRPREEPVLVVALAAHDHDDEAQQLARASIEADARAGRGERRVAWLDAAVRAFATGDVPLGRLVVEETDRQLPDDVTRAGSARARVLDLFAHELAGCADEVDDEVFCALASVIARGDDDAKELEAIRRADPVAARRKFATLVTRSAPLAAYAAPPLLGEVWIDPALEPARTKPRGAHWLVVVAVLALFRMVPALLQSSTHYDPPSTRVFRTVDEAPRGEPTLADAETLCFAGSRTQACLTARGIADALGAHDCMRALALASELESLAAGEHIRSRAARAAADQLIVRVVSECSAPARDGGP